MEIKNRIEFVDLAKGVCILLVVMNHIGVPECIPGLYAAKVPIFFVLSGLFFLNQVNRGGYFVNMSKSIIFPFLIYYFVSYILFYLMNWIKPDLLGENHGFSIIDIFRQRNLFNGPLWFLLSLAEVELLFLALWKLIKNEKWRCCIILSIAILGFALSEFKIFVALWLDTTMVASLFFYMGIIISRTAFLTDKPKPFFLIVSGFFSYMIFLLFPVRIQMSTNQYSNVYLTVISGMAIVGFILFVCKLIKKLPLINWIGTNSLIILCTHHLIYRPIRVLLMKLGTDNVLILFLVTMIIEVPVIYIINRWLPVLAGKLGKANKQRFKA